VFDLINVNDAAESILKTINYNKSDIFNIGSGEPITPLSLITKIEKLLNKKIKKIKKPYRKVEVKNFYININKAKRVLGFIPRYNLEDEIRDIVKENSIVK